MKVWGPQTIGLLPLKMRRWQVPMLSVRPQVKSEPRPLWYAGHHTLGRVFRRKTQKHAGVFCWAQRVLPTCRWLEDIFEGKDGKLYPSEYENLSSWWFQIFFIFTPTWGDNPILTNIFQMGWFNHQLVINAYNEWFQPAATTSINGNPLTLAKALLSFGELERAVEAFRQPSWDFSTCHEI